ncbi:MAG: peptide chain release factor 3 [Myxococcota bacterium]
MSSPEVEKGGAGEAAAVGREVARRRTFAIISHPDAGKTTLTEKLLLYGGAIQVAGAVKAKRGRANAVSDWMEMERERGISISTSVMQFPYKGLHMNLLDTPGHADFSEDTYRTLHAVDGAVMLLDCAKGVESQTKKLFRVCRQRSIPIFTFVNKLDRPGRDPFDLVGEVESVLGIGVYPITWPVFRSGVFQGVYHRLRRRVLLFSPEQALSSAGVGSRRIESMEVDDPSDQRLTELLGEEGHAKLMEDAEILDAAGDDFDAESFVSGEISPMFFGSAINNFGLEPFLESFCEMMPEPRGRASNEGQTEPREPRFSAFVFKVQANMDRAHRDRVAFMRICTGRFERGMKVLHVRTGREMRLANPTQFLAQERKVVDEAYAGDVIGVYDPGTFEIGDTVTAGHSLEYEPIPSFAPEHFARLIMIDPLKREQLARGVDQLSLEGVIQVYRPPEGRAGDMILGAVGQLQLEVMRHRLEVEYGVRVRLDPVRYRFARWVSSKNGGEPDLDELSRNQSGLVALDSRGRPVVLFEGDWQLKTAERHVPSVLFSETASGVVMRG